MPMKMKGIKGIDLSCTTPSSTAICSSTELRSMVRNGPKPLPHERLRDQYLANNFHYNFLSSSPDNNNNNKLLAPCISELPFSPRPSSSFSSRRRSSADVCDIQKDIGRAPRSTCSPPPSRKHSSSRYLLGGAHFLEDDEEDYKYCSALVPSTPIVKSKEREFMTKSRSTNGSFVNGNRKMANTTTTTNYNRQAERSIGYGTEYGHTHTTSVGHRQYKCTNSTLVKSSSSSASSKDQVVMLRVSLHCKGCAGKLRKYLSKMEGVKSFDIDLETKKVTVIGNVTPLGVLSSISKVKNAQLWPSPASSSSTSSSSSSSSSTFDYNY